MDEGNMNNGHQASLVEELRKQGLETIKFNESKYTHEQIGEGFWGEVFKIKSNGRVMVLKTCKQGGAKLTQNEINIMRSLDHPNIVKFLGVCITDNGILYPLLEYINGGTLDDFLTNDNFDISYISRFCIAENIASGMAYLHERNIMHRDLTSSNILLRVSAEHERVMDVEEALITDFGLAKSMAVSNERALSQVGSVDWMAPEIILGKEYDKKADVFSYGIILCEIIGRCVADPDNSVFRTINFEVNFEEFTKYSCEGCPKDFLDLAKKCCKLNPEDRPEFAEIKEFCTSLICSYYLPSSADLQEADMSITQTSMDKLNISEPETVSSWDLQPRFNLNTDFVRPLEDDVPMAAVPSRRNSTASSIINPIPSVNRYSGAIVYTIRNDISPVELQRPTIPEEIVLQNRSDTQLALDHLSRHSTLVYFDNLVPNFVPEPANCVASSGSLATPFGKRQYSKRKKIRPGKLRKPAKSPRSDTKGTKIINFFKNLGSSGGGGGGSKEGKEGGQGKGKISKGEMDQDTYSGLVTARGPPPLSPTPRRLRDFPGFWSSEERSGAPTTPTTPTAPLPTATSTPTHPGPKSHISVTRNDSYRMMKPFRAQSVPLDPAMEGEDSIGPRTRSLKSDPLGGQKKKK